MKASLDKKKEMDRIERKGIKGMLGTAVTCHVTTTEITSKPSPNPTQPEADNPPFFSHTSSPLSFASPPY